MNSFQALIFNVFILISFGVWAIIDVYNFNGTDILLSVFIVPFVAIVLLVLSPWVAKQKNKSLLICAILCVLLLVYFIINLKSSQGEGKLRIIVQIATCTWSIIFLVKNLIANRLNKSKNAEIDLKI